MSAQPKILVIEDEEPVRLGIVEGLKLEGYQVVWSDNGIDGLKLYNQDKPDLLILDWMVPGLDGLEVCKRIRATDGGVPVIMLTARCSEVDKVVGLEIGADDYLTKPFGMRELFARIKAVLRRSAAGNSRNGEAEKANSTDGSVKTDFSQISFGEVEVDFRAYRAKRGATELMLSAKEFELLKYLAQRADIAVTRDELLDRVWGYNSYPTTRTVDNFIARLRHKVEQTPEHPRHILTVHGVGYKFVST